MNGFRYKPIYPTDNACIEINFVHRVGETGYECYFSTSIRYNESALTRGPASTFPGRSARENR